MLLMKCEVMKKGIPNCNFWGFQGLEVEDMNVIMKGWETNEVLDSSNFPI